MEVVALDIDYILIRTLLAWWKIQFCKSQLWNHEAKEKNKDCELHKDERLNTFKGRYPFCWHTQALKL